MSAFTEKELDGLPALYEDIFRKLLPEEAAVVSTLRKIFRLRVRYGKTCRVRRSFLNLFRFTVEVDQNESPTQTIAFPAYVWCWLSMYTVGRANKWPKWLWSLYDVALGCAAVARKVGRDAAVLHLTDVLSNEGEWEGVEDYGFGPDWAHLTGAILLLECMQFLEFNQLSDKSNWPEIEKLAEKIPDRTWYSRREAIETCVDKIIAVTS